jgi:hypothetical protein
VSLAFSDSSYAPVEALWRVITTGAKADMPVAPEINRGIRHPLLVESSEFSAP